MATCIVPARFGGDLQVVEDCDIDERDHVRGTCHNDPEKTATLPRNFQNAACTYNENT
jgi:hypothetical protein